jgi:hypothetical protein
MKATGKRVFTAVHCSRSCCRLPTVRGDVVSACLDFSLPVIVSTHPALIEAAQGLMPTIDPNDRDGWLARILQLAENKTDLADIQRSIVRIHRPTVCSVPIRTESCNTILAAITEYS